MTLMSEGSQSVVYRRHEATAAKRHDHMLQPSKFLTVIPSVVADASGGR